MSVKDNVEKAKIILAQLGGKRFAAMTGSRDFLALENGLRMKLARNNSRANILEITLDPNDTYSLRFYKYTRGRLNKKTLAYVPDKITEVKNYNDIYCDQLQDIFTDVTGLYTHL